MFGLLHRITRLHHAEDETPLVVPEESPLAKIACTAREFLAQTGLILAIKPLKIVRRVSFCRSVDVLLVPCLAEYRAANVMSSVWWSAMEMKQFRVEAYHSVQRCMTRFTSLNRRQAMRIVVIDPEAFMSDEMLLPLVVL